MARMEKNLFYYLTTRNIFKRYMRSTRADEKTEQRRQERNFGRMVWLSSAMRTGADGLQRNIGKGTFRRALHGELPER